MSRTHNDSRDSTQTSFASSTDGEDAPTVLRGVAMFHVGRSGSTVLGDLLHQNPAVHWDGEIYERIFQEVGRKVGPLFLASDAPPLAFEQQAWRTFLPSDPLRYLQERIEVTPKSVYGFEVKFFHLRFFGMSIVDYVAGLKLFGFDAFLLLKRRNFLRGVVSSLVAAQAKQYHFRNAEEVRCRPIVLDLERIEMDREEKSFFQFLEKYNAMFELLEELLEGERVLELVYEDDLLDDPRRGYRKVCEFLNLSDDPSEVRFVRSTPFPLREILVNFEEVARTLRGTPHAWMLDE